MLVRVWRKVNPLALLGMQIGAANMEKSMEKIELLYDPAVPLLKRVFI